MKYQIISDQQWNGMEPPKQKKKKNNEPMVLLRVDENGAKYYGKVK